ncbi:integral membrane protein GPR155 isoform X1 [Frankliniella occidentalis]|uniref:Integral membrane protein GPR155 isoform X1 n=1 Tax=Frankliniella occidentalis TaxID=133901 RepID=A0A6J1TK70_FRAOC|nr:integral membrane protein GPR155 isoform X1 [Frankliniella occidentalis]XP_026292080.2 integral membrane protein GPR155 isoform X1 [Frankliniella occidentalis]XP_052127754.1 integral membrane protein GPR155 isoform X1 [Frankliniella occidentalis]
MSNGEVTIPSPNLEDIAVDNLYPALVECFAVIICGYVAGRLGILPPSETKGLNTFVANFSLPCLIFRSIAKLDLSSVNWTFLLAILVAKAVVFFGVALISLVVTRPINLPKAGLFAIFCTQSNDFAIGYPILVALYQNTHPAYPSYLYLMAPISLVILNPLGFILMEMGRPESALSTSSATDAPEMRASGTGGNREKIRMIWQVIKGIISNPVVFMTALGIVGNLVFDHELPTFLDGILKVFGNAFSATALFLLGSRMVGTVQKLQGAALIVPALLIAVKLLALPLITREVVSVIHAGANESDTEDLSTYGFLYGTFPSAPGVFVFATQYGVEVELIASAMVVCTFVSAPLMFVSAKMISLSSLLPPDYVKQLNNFAFDIAIASGIASVWLLATFIFCSKIKRIPHRMTVCLITSQLIASIGVILSQSMSSDKIWHLRFYFAVYTIGDLSSRLWSAFIAIGLLLLQSRSLCLVMRLQLIFILLAWGIPTLIVLVLLLVADPVDPSSVGPPDFSSLYGDLQTSVTLAVLFISFMSIVFCLAYHQRYQRRFARYLLLVQDVNDNQDSTSSAVNTERFSPAGPDNSINSSNQVVDIEDISTEHGRILQNVGGSTSRLPPCPGDLCPSRFECSAVRRADCNRLIQDYHKQLAEEEEDRQVQRHQVALMMMCCSMFLGMAVCTWRLVMDNLTGIYVELAFLDVALNQGQGLLLLAVFGLHSKAMILPLVNLCREMWVNEDQEIPLPAWDQLDFETRHVCDQFITHHIETCRATIAKDKRWFFRTYASCFKASELIDWLVNMEVVRTREEGIAYCCHLVQGRVIRNFGNVNNFQDTPVLYTFLPSTSNNVPFDGSDSF